MRLAGHLRLLPPLADRGARRALHGQDRPRAAPARRPARGLGAGRAAERAAGAPRLAGMSPAARLAALADEELALVTDGRADELAGLAARREAGARRPEARRTRHDDPPSGCCSSTPPACRPWPPRPSAARWRARCGPVQRTGLSRTAAQGYRAAAGPLAAGRSSSRDPPGRHTERRPGRASQPTSAMEARSSPPHLLMDLFDTTQVSLARRPARLLGPPAGDRRRTSRTSTRPATAASTSTSTTRSGGAWAPATTPAIERLDAAPRRSTPRAPCAPTATRVDVDTESAADGRQRRSQYESARQVLKARIDILQSAIGIG